MFTLVASYSCEVETIVLFLSNFIDHYQNQMLVFTQTVIFIPAYIVVSKHKLTVSKCH